MKKNLISILILIFCINVVLADFDADNKPDIFTVENGSVIWYESISGDNGLTYFTQITTGGAAIAIDDFDGDGKTDLIIGKTGTNSTSSWYEADANDGGYMLINDVLDGWVKPNGAAICDYDADGMQDLFLVLDNGNVSYWTATGNNTCTWVATLTGSANAIVSGNLDGDNYDELLVFKSDGIHWYENDAWQRVFGESNLDTGVIGNIDNDSMGDLLVVTSSGTIKWYECLASDTVPTYIMTFDSNAISLYIFDVDSDGLSEVCVSHSNGPVTWWEAYPDNVADGDNLDIARNSVHCVSGENIGDGSTDIKANYFDPDNYADVFTIEYGNVKWYESHYPNNRMGSIGSLGITNATAIALGSFDSDYKKDLIVARTGAGYSTLWYEEDANDDSIRLVNSNIDGYVTQNGVAFADIDNDGKKELFLVMTWGNASYYRSNSDDSLVSLGTYTSGVLSCCGGRFDSDSYDDVFFAKNNGINWVENSIDICVFGDPNTKGLSLGDIDGDDYRDLLIITEAGSIKWYEATGTNNAAPDYVMTFENNVSSVAIVDVDSDGVIAYSDFEGMGEVLVTKSNGDTVWYETTGNNHLVKVSGSSVEANSVGIGGGFFDRDNKPDLFMVRSSGDVSWYEFSNDNLVRNCKQITDDATGIVAGNFDNDKYMDLISAKSGTNAIWYEATNEDGNYVTISSSFLSNAKKSMAIGRIDRDSYGDIFMINSSGNVYWYEATGNNTFTTRSNSDITDVQALAMGDFDRDGLTDLMVAKSDRLSWYEEPGSDNSIPVLVDAFTYITNSQALAMGDIDGDQLCDLLVITSTGDVEWYWTHDWWITYSSLSPVYKETFDSNATSVAIVDADSDGTNEILVTHSNSTVSWFETVKAADGSCYLQKVLGTSFAANASSISALGFTYENMTLPCIVYTRDCYNSYDNLFFPGIGVKDLYGSNRILASCLEGVHPSNQWGLHMGSLDWGYSWIGGGYPIGFLVYYEFPGEDSAICIGFDTTKISNRVFKGDIQYITANEEVTGYDCNIYFTQDMDVVYFHRGVVMLPSGNLLAGVYGKLQGDDNFMALIVESADRGMNWNYKSTLYESTLDWGSEVDIERLANGNILAAIRRREPMFDTASQCEMLYKISTDSGASWSNANYYGQVGVDPDLLRLSSDRIVLSYGRPGIHLLFADANGLNWSEPIDIYFGSGCGYTAMVNDEQEDIRLFYTKSDFAGHQLYPGPINYMTMAKIAVEHPSIPNFAHGPYPTNGSTSVDKEADLKWIPGNRADSHDVYIGTNYNDVLNATRVSGEYIGNVYGASFALQTLQSGRVYYWRVDAVNNSGTKKGYVWSFTTVPAIVFSDGFETSFDKWTDGGTTDWDRTTSYKYYGSYSAHAGSADNDLFSDNINTSGYSSMTITFWYMDDDIDDDDNIYLQLYDGSAYDNKFELGNTSPEDTWTQYEVTIYNTGSDAQYFISNFRLKFEGTSIDSGENLWIDDVLVTALY